MHESKGLGSRDLLFLKGFFTAGGFRTGVRLDMIKFRYSIF